MRLRMYFYTHLVFCSLLLYSSAGLTAEQLVPQVLNTYPHDTAAFTQGLLLYDGELYESTGLWGQSSLRRVNYETGEVLQKIDINEDYFAEGLARVDERLVQLTWKAGRAFVYDIDSFEELSQFEYVSEGWGLCYDGSQLVLSDGTARLSFRDPESFEEIKAITVTLEGDSVSRLNELECVEDVIYANVWQTDQIMRIDKATGDVTAVIDAPDLLTEEEAQTADVLNGIAYRPETETFFITGKRWPKLFEVQFVASDGDVDGDTDGDSDSDSDADSDMDTDTESGADGDTDTDIDLDDLDHLEDCGCRTVGGSVNQHWTTLFGDWWLF